MKKLLLGAVLATSIGAHASDASYLELALGQLRYQVDHASLPNAPSGDAAYLELAYSYPLTSSIEARFSVGSTNRDRWGSQTDVISAAAGSTTLDSSRASRFSSLGAALEWHSEEVSKGVSYAIRGGMAFWQDDQNYQATIKSTTNADLTSQKDIAHKVYGHDEQLTFTVGATVQYHLDQHDSINIGLDYSTASLQPVERDLVRSFERFDYKLTRLTLGFRHRY